jgi:hypothetical protein
MFFGHDMRLGESPKVKLLGSIKRLFSANLGMVPSPLAHPNPPQPFGNGLFELETNTGNSLNPAEGIGLYPSSASLHAFRYHLSVHVKGSRFHLPVEEYETGCHCIKILRSFRSNRGTGD